MVKEMYEAHQKIRNAIDGSRRVRELNRKPRKDETDSALIIIDLHKLLRLIRRSSPSLTATEMLEYSRDGRAASVACSLSLSYEG
jgi:hypothetical protein